VTSDTQRDHALDFLRATMMFLGIMLHGMLSFTTVPVPFWPARDGESSPAADLFIFIVHDFRMQTFFFLAGYFSGLIDERYSLAGMSRHRFTRLVIPFVGALLVIQPILQALWLLGDRSALRFVGINIDDSRLGWELVTDHFLSGAFLEAITPFHLWFLYFLILFVLAAIPFKALATSRPFRPFATMVATRWSTLMDRPWLFLALLTIATAPLAWLMKIPGVVDTPGRWETPPHLLGYYFLFFGTGWLVWRDRERLPAMLKRWKLVALAALGLVLPLYLIVIARGLEAYRDRQEPSGMLRVLSAGVCSLFTWMILLSLLGLFRSLFQRRNAVIRYLADASYWCYLWHLVPIVALQILLANSPLPGLLKFIVIIAGSMALLFASYEWLVRYTFVGAILNGRKSRKIIDQ
jgi:peptidoglycan/LPS O-acetylase OafA/YrhL